MVFACASYALPSHFWYRGYLKIRGKGARKGGKKVLDYDNVGLVVGIASMLYGRDVPDQYFCTWIFSHSQGRVIEVTSDPTDLPPFQCFRIYAFLKIMSKIVYLVALARIEVNCVRRRMLVDNFWRL